MTHFDLNFWNFFVHQTLGLILYFCSSVEENFMKFYTPIEEYLYFFCSWRTAFCTTHTTASQCSSLPLHYQTATGIASKSNGSVPTSLWASTMDYVTHYYQCWPIRSKDSTSGRSSLVDRILQLDYWHRKLGTLKVVYRWGKLQNHWVWLTLLYESALDYATH